MNQRPRLGGGAAGRPFPAVIFCHGAHIPYVASPATRARYANVTSPATGLPMDENEQDYWGTITQIDAQVCACTT